MITCKKETKQNMEPTYEYWSEFIAFCFVSNGISVCTIIIADDTVLVQLEATVPVVTVHSYRLLFVECVLLAINCEKCHHLTGC